MICILQTNNIIFIILTDGLLDSKTLVSVGVDISVKLSSMHPTSNCNTITKKDGCENKAKKKDDVCNTENSDKSGVYEEQQTLDKDEETENEGSIDDEDKNDEDGMEEESG